MALIIMQNCTACDACEPVCPIEAIKAGEPIYRIDPFKCTECVGHFAWDSRLELIWKLKGPGSSWAAAEASGARAPRAAGLTARGPTHRASAVLATVCRSPRGAQEAISRNCQRAWGIVSLSEFCGAQVTEK